MPATTTVLYAAEGAKFDMKYLIDTHMPLAMKYWGPHGLIGYDISSLTTVDGHKSPYSVQLLLKWNAVDSVEKAAQAPDSKHVFEDAENFTSVPAVYMTGEVVASK